MSLNRHVVCLLPVFAIVAACSGVQHSGEDYAPTVIPKPNFFLRTSIDQDPSVYLGRFIADDTSPDSIDDSAAMQLTCSEFFTVKKIPAAGVEYDEYFQAGTAASASLGIPQMQLAVSAERVRAVRVQYTATEKWVAHLEDPAGFEACCKQAPDQCTGWYVGEFLAGTGAIYTVAKEKSQAGASGNIKGVPADAELKDGIVWRRSVVFKQPAFFAFKRTQNRYHGGAAGGDHCEYDYDNKVPRSSQGSFFVGVSDWLKSERVARSQAMLDARRQVIRFIGEQIKQGAIGRETTGGNVEALETQLSDDAFVERASQGLARFVKDECWKVKEQEGPDGWRWQAKVLAFVPKDQVAAAAAALDAMLAPTP